MKSRCRLLSLSFDLLSELVRGRLVVEGLPDDVSVVDVRTTDCFQTVDLLLHSETYPEMRPGDQFVREYASLHLRSANKVEGIDASKCST